MIQLIRFMRDAEDFNTGGSMQQTPIEKAIAELDSQLKWQLTDGEKFMLSQFRNTLTVLLPYEKQYLRDVAEEAWGESIDAVVSNASIGHPSLGEDLFVDINYKDIQQEKQTYLDQNYPLKSKEVTSNLPGIDNKDVKPSNPQLVKETI